MASLHSNLNVKTNGEINSKIDNHTIKFEHCGCV